MKKFFKIFLIIVFSLIFTFSTYKVVMISLDYKNAEEEYTDTAEQFTKIDNTQNLIEKEKPIIQKESVKEELIQENKNQVSTEEIKIEVQEEVIPEPEVWAPLAIDFEGLKKQNSDTIGWIRIFNTTINHPIVQGETNDTYIRTSFKKKSYVAGSIFVDASNSKDFSDFNTIIYGHNMKDGSMFAPLKNYKDKKGFLNDHKYIEIYTENDGLTVYEIVALFVVDNLNEVYSSFDQTEEQYIDWLNRISQISLNGTSNIDYSKKSITLSTCYGPSGTSNRLLIVLQKSDNF